MLTSYRSLFETSWFGTEYSIVDFIATHNTDTYEKVSVGCGGTYVNTDRVGVIRLLDDYLGERPLQWLVCLLHADKLPVCHLFKYFDRYTTGSRCILDTIGKHVNGCEKLETVGFVPVFTAQTSLPRATYLGAGY
jgi:hypothetical protein